MYLSLLPSKALLNDVKYIFLEVNEVIYFWLCRVSVVESESELSLVAVCGLHGLLIAMASLDVEHELKRAWASVVVVSALERAWASVVVARRLSGSTACGIFPDQGHNLCPLHL